MTGGADDRRHRAGPRTGDNPPRTLAFQSGEEDPGGEGPEERQGKGRVEGRSEGPEGRAQGRRARRRAAGRQPSHRDRQDAATAPEPRPTRDRRARRDDASDTNGATPPARRRSTATTPPAAVHRDASRPPPRTPAAAKPAAAPTRAPRRRRSDTNGVARAEPTLTIVETRILRGPNYWAREPVIRQVVDLGVLEEFPSNKIPGFVDALVGDAPDARGPRLQPRPARRVHHPAPRGHLGGPRRRAHRARVPEPRRDRRPPRQDPRHRRVRPLQRDLRVPRGAGRDRGRADGRRAREPPRRALGRGVRLRPHGGAREADPARGAARLRPEHAGAPRRGRRPRHPVHPARPVQPRPARPGRPPAAHPRDDDQPHAADRASTSRATRS